MKSPFLAGLCLLAFTSLGSAADAPLSLQPKTAIQATLWNSKQMENEPVLFVQETGESVATGKLLFRPKGKLKITHPDLAMTYKEGADYVWSPERDRIELTISSRIPFKTAAQMNPSAGSPNTRGGVLWSEGHFFHDLQVQVTYEHEDLFPWRPAPAVNTLGRSLQKLRSQKPFKLVAMGDSITEGFNASGFKKCAAPPYQPGYAQLVANTLERRFGAPVTLENFGIAGTKATRGLTQLEKLRAENPDLITIAYGMNHKEQSSDFAETLRKLLAAVQEACPAADVVLVSPMTQRPPVDKFIGYRDALAEMVSSNVALADVTTPWLEILQRKPFSDISGNNINHPNDFGHRLYASVICDLFEP
jgi:acyl-CoA thioesterase I